MKNAPLSASVFNIVCAIILCACSMPSTRQAVESETAPEGLTVLDEAALNLKAGPVSFERQVKPILESKCFACHSGNAAMAGFNVESGTFAMTRESGVQRIVPGKPESSRFLDLAGTHHKVAGMPPVGNRLTGTERKILWRWVEEGAHWPQGKAGQLHQNTANLHPERVPD